MLEPKLSVAISPFTTIDCVKLLLAPFLNTENRFSPPTEIPLSDRCRITTLLMLDQPSTAMPPTVDQSTGMSDASISVCGDGPSAAMRINASLILSGCAGQ